MAQIQMRLLIGTYTRGTDSDGIYAAQFDATSGRFSNLRLVTPADNPAWILNRGSRVIVANEFDDGLAGGEISVFAASADELRLEDQVSSQGAHPCHLACSDSRLYAANYNGATVTLYEWSATGLGALVKVIKHQHGGTHPRQAAAHPHGVYLIGAELWVPDLGADRIYRYQPENGTPLGVLKLASGAGPRHLSANGDYLINELDNTIVQIETGVALPGCATLPAEILTPSSTAEIQTSGEYLYASNRLDDQDGIITVFETRPALRAVQHQTSAGQHPRHFLIDPSGRWLLVANKDSNNIVSIPIDQAGRLAAPVATIACPSPVHLVPWN